MAILQRIEDNRSDLLRKTLGNSGLAIMRANANSLKLRTYR